MIVTMKERGGEMLVFQGGRGTLQLAAVASVRGVNTPAARASSCPLTSRKAELGRAACAQLAGAGESPGRSPPAWLNKVGTANRLVKE